MGSSQHREPLSDEALFEGVLLGTAVGDALGLAAEGLSAGVIAKRFGRVDRYRILGSVGWVSDDTEQSALVAQSLVRSAGDVEETVSAFRRAILGWFWRLPWGLGLATLRACLKLTLGLAKSGVRSAGNGAAMRSAIVGAYFRDDERTRSRAASALAEVTHTDSRAVEGAVFVADVVAAEGTGRARLVAARERVTNPELGASIDRALALADAGTTMLDAARTLGNTGFTVHTLALASFAFAREEGRSVREILPELYGAGGDTDSIGAIVGAWLGAQRGVEAFDALWIERLQSGPFGLAHLRALATALARARSSGRGTQAPRFSWPWALARNLLMVPVILAHGFRRLAPPYV
ncbi:MAG: ADP-ribosylglycohydrolase family protein [Myxococcales bacterium]|nr:ADP-ribosylglycohydrolase family protein [Myxococcales bacterium]